MKHTPSQTILRIIGILQHISGLVFMLFFGLIIYGLLKQDVNAQITVNGEVVFDLIKLLINAVLLFVGGHIFKKVSKDASKHNSALTITLVIIAFEIFNFITSLGIGIPTNLVGMIVSVVINMVALFFISKTREAYIQYLHNKRKDS